MALISAPSVNSRFAQLSITALLLLGAFYFLLPSFDAVRHLPIPKLQSAPKPPTKGSSSSETNTYPPKPNHPIDHLIQSAERGFQNLLTKETHTLHDAAEAYRLRRGRHPPPHFDAWHAFAQNRSALIVEDFFDQIYHDLAPFWGVHAKDIREQANDFVHRVSVRDGKVAKRTDIPQREWMNLWADMVASICNGVVEEETEGKDKGEGDAAEGDGYGGWCPDVDLPINVMDESRIVVPWEEINVYMAAEARTRHVTTATDLKSSYQSLKGLDTHPPPHFDPAFSGEGPYWPLYVVGCPPDSPARTAYIETDFSLPPPFHPSTYPLGSYEGYVQNWTLAKSPCANPELQGLHGTFVEPISISNTKKLFPLFGGSKLPMNNEILLPPAMYWTKDPFYSGGNEHGVPWEEKKDGLIWRGAASGGRNRKENWTRFQRHRFVSMMNSTSVLLAETDPEYHSPPNFALPANGSYDLAPFSSTQPPGSLAHWIDTWSDAAVVHLLCFPGPEPPAHSRHCAYTDPYFSVAKSLPMKEQYAYKYLPDIDGNSFSGRYRGFLGSTSLPIKATIYQEWHDSRLVPWVHFIPMDNTFSDIYGIMEYFLGYEPKEDGEEKGGEGVGGHDEVAKKIALDGKSWAERVLRREDMEVYVLRLLLEFARVCDEERESMGWKEEG